MSSDEETVQDKQKEEVSHPKESKQEATLAHSSSTGSDGGNVESFSLVDERKKIKKNLGYFSRDKAFKQLSLQAFQLPPDNKYTEEMVDEIVLKMLSKEDGVPIGKHKSGLLESHDNCFTGEEMFQWMQKHLHIENEQDVIQKGQTIFMNRGIFYSIIKKHSSFHNKSDVLYRFRILEAPTAEETVLNQVKNYLLEFDGNACQLSTELTQLLHKALSAHTNSSGQPDFKEVESSTDFQRFVLLTAALQKASLDELTAEERLVFFINIYNALLLHCFVRYGPPQSAIARKNLLPKSYTIDGRQYSVENIWSILRGNEIKDLATVPLNPLIHITCVTGSDASAPFRSYTVESFNENSKTFAREFFEKHITFKSETDEVWLPKQFKENAKDFGDSDVEILKWIAKLWTEKESYLKTYLTNIHVKFKENTYNNIQYISK